MWNKACQRNYWNVNGERPMTTIDWKGLSTGIVITLMIAGIFSFLNYAWISPMIDEVLKADDCNKNWKLFVGDTEDAERKTCADWNHIVSINNPEMHTFGFVFSTILVPGGFAFMYFFTFRAHIKDEEPASPFRTLPKGFDDTPSKEDRSQ